MHVHTHVIYAIIINSIWPFRDGSTYFICDNNEIMLHLTVQTFSTTLTSNHQRIREAFDN